MMISSSIGCLIVVVVENQKLWRLKNDSSRSGTEKRLFKLHSEDWAKVWAWPTRSWDRTVFLGQDISNQFTTIWLLLDAIIQSMG